MILYSDRLSQPLYYLDHPYYSFLLQVSVTYALYVCVCVCLCVVCAYLCTNVYVYTLVLVVCIEAAKLNLDTIEIISCSMLIIRTF